MRRPAPVLLIWLLVPIALLGLNWQKVSYYLRPAPVTLPVPVASPRLADQLEQPARPSPAQPARSTAKPLADCLAGGTTIDDHVLRCRFGEVPHTKPDAEPARGMVSAAYLAQYRAERSQRSAGADAAQGVGYEQYSIPGWDGTGRYLASWQVNGNDIDHASVCLNYRRGSIEYRECRKAAKQWFRNQCRRIEETDTAESRRYCSAASSFSPMG